MRIIPTTTEVAIIGAGPAGLLLGHILQQSGIPFVILENRSQEYALSRVRAGVLEQGSVDIMTELGLDANLQARAIPHDTVVLQFEGERRAVDLRGLTGRPLVTYGQQAVVADLIEAHEAIDSPIVWEAQDVEPHGIDGPNPVVTYTAGGRRRELQARIVVGADGYHGVCRPSIPGIKAYERTYPYGWLGILTDTGPATDDLIYSLHPDGFSLHSMRSHQVSRLYVQVPPEADLTDWPDDRVWEALHTRLDVPGWSVAEGGVTEKSITPMRSFVASTLSHGSLFLVGDAGHIVPPTGAKGLNGAIADVILLGRALRDRAAGDESALATYSERALDRQWKTQHFSQWMTRMMHVEPGGDPSEREFRYRSQIAELDYYTSHEQGLAALADQYVGLSIDAFDASRYRREHVRAA